MNNLIHLQRFLHARDNLRRLRESLVPGINFFSICSGIEAASVAWNPLGWRCVGVSEIEKFPSAVLGHHYPHVRNHGDFTKIDASRLPRVDILCGGTPCQAFSVAGSRRSLDDARGNLTLAFVKLAHEINPRNVVWENVPGVLSTKDNAFGCFLAGLVGATDALIPSADIPDIGKSNRFYRWDRKEQRHIATWPNAGMVAGPKGRAAWRVLDAQFFGLAQRRKRVILVADFGNGADPAAVLFEPESVRRDSPPSRETGQTTTSPDSKGAGGGIVGTLSARTKGGGGLGTDFDPDGGLVPHPASVAVLRGHSDYGDGVPSLRANGGDCAGGSEALVFAPDIARCVATREGSSQDYESTTMVAVHAIQAGALRTNPNSGPDGVGVQADIAYTLEARAEVQAVSVTGPISHALKAEGADASEDGTGRGTPIIACAQVADTLTSNGDAHSGYRDEKGLVAQTVALRGREGGATAELGGDVATALRASSGGGDKPHVLAFDTYNQSVSDITHTLRDPHGTFGDALPAVLTSAVRRLTPVECERLQGFPDDYTRIPWRNRPASDCPDGPRYKALGNSWAVPLFNWLGKRIAARL